MSDENSQWVPRDPGTRPEAWTDQAQQAPYVSGAGQTPTAGAAPQAPSAAPSAAETEQLPRVQEGAWLPGADETAQLPRVDGAALPLSAQETMQLPRVQETMQLPRVQETAQLPSATAGQFQSAASPAYGQVGFEAGPAYGQAGFEAGPAYGQFQSEGSPAYGQPPAEAGQAYGQEAPAGDGPHDFPQLVGQMPLQQGAPEYAPVTGAPEYAPVTGAAVVRKGPGWLALVASMLVTALVTAGGLWFVLRPDSTQDSSAASANGGTVASVASADSAPDWQAVSSAVSPAVVTIQVQSSSSTGMGSGVVYDAKGDIVTNYHVIAAAVQSGGKIQVTLADGRIYDAELTGTDPATDLAVVQIVNAPDDLTVAQIGDSNQVVTGQDVMAIGNPLGLSSTVTTGIVSAINRPVVTEQKDQPDQSQGGSPGGSSTPGLGGVLQPSQSSTKTCTNAIQIDAAVNPGNSGGPLFDETGKLIGITSSIATLGSSSSGSSASGSIGIGFAIPGNLAVKVADQLIKTGTATHAFLGVALDNGSEKADGETRAGAKVTTVEPDSPAAKAGIEVGDVITAIDGKTTNQPAALTGFVRQYSAGDTVKLTVIRNGEKKEIEVTLVERKDS